MEKTVSAFEARRQFGKIIQDVLTNHDCYVVERHGQPVAAVVPIELLNQWKRGRQAFFDHWKSVAEMINLPAEEAERVALEATEEVRRSPAVR
ncbi:MAG: type II toxin-antitoxin system Phd/YefM family antitoxin [Dehalococcoidia bacterium]|nr:type II toxin-antitoxin system Phd/YefM family antitoxin [Dehalococcoidia bacterium]